MRSFKFWQKLIIVMVLVSVFFILGQQSTFATPDMSFSDVPSNHWAYSWISYFGDLSITTGCGGGNFCPENHVQRSEMAVFLVRMWNKLNDGDTNGTVWTRSPVINTDPGVTNSYLGDQFKWRDSNGYASLWAFPDTGQLYLGSPTNDGDLYIKNSSNATTFQVDGQTGSFYASGTKSALVSTETNGQVLMYAMESPENWFEDFGKASLINGEAVIEIDPVFAETVNLDHDYHVFTTPNCEVPVILFVTEKAADYFTVSGVSLEGEKSQCTLDYRIVAKRMGYENLRLESLAVDTDSDSAETEALRMEQLRNAGYSEQKQILVDDMDAQDFEIFLNESKE